MPQNYILILYLYRIRKPRVYQQPLGSRVTRKNMKHFRELSKYDYFVENKIESITGREYTAFVCGHPSGCRKEFDRPWNLLDHVRTHNGVRPHACPFCSLSFVQKGNRNKHVLIHLKRGEQLPTE